MIIIDDDGIMHDVVPKKVLEQIRAEIAELPEDMGTIKDIRSGEIVGKYISSIKVLQIIDKYIK